MKITINCNSKTNLIKSLRSYEMCFFFNTEVDLIALIFTHDDFKHCVLPNVEKDEESRVSRVRSSLSGDGGPLGTKTFS